MVHNNNASFGFICIFKINGNNNIKLKRNKKKSKCSKIRLLFQRKIQQSILDFDRSRIYAKFLAYLLEDYQPEWPDQALEFQCKKLFMTHFWLPFSEIIKESHGRERTKTIKVPQDLNLGALLCQIRWLSLHPRDRERQ